MPKQIVSVLVGMLALVMVAAGSTPVFSATKMPAFRLADVVSGQPIDSSSFHGKSLLVTFFASWCPPCIQEIPNLINLQNRYGEQQFSVIGLSVDQEQEVVRTLVSDRNINYPVMMADNEITVRFGGVFGIPTSFLVNRNGTVVKKYSGYVPHAVLVRDLQQIMD